MPAPKQNQMSNKLLAMLPEADYNEIAPYLDHIPLPKAMVLSEMGKPIDTIYFLTSGIASVVVRTPEGNRGEAGLFGFDGYAPTTGMAPTEISPHDVHMQLEGEGYRIEYGVFHRIMESNRNLFKLIVRAMEAFMIQVSYTAASNAIHDVNERLARWLLMCHDRVAADELRLTHEFLALMLMVRRPSVTTSLHVLEGNRFIRAERGVITIRDRRALEEFAHDAYGKPEEEYRRLMKDIF